MRRLVLACTVLASCAASTTSTAQDLPVARSPGAWPDAVLEGTLRGVAPVESSAISDPSAWRPSVRLAQVSRSELFGSDQPADAQPKSVRLSGFVEGLLAYTYAKPVHWSRAVGRLQLTGQGELADDVKWKLSARVDADPVYFLSDYYRSDVKHDQRADFFFRENYIDFSRGAWDFRLGAQQIVWGEVVGLFFADVVSARDMREFVLPSFDVIRIPQWAARAEYTKGDAHVELVWIPVPVYDRIGKPGADFYPAPLPSPLPDSVAELFRDPVRPERSLANGNFGVRVNTLVSGWDLAGFAYRSFSTDPTFYREPGDDPTQPFIFQPRYDRLTQLGATLSKDFDSFVLRGEIVHTHGRGFTLADLSAPQGVVKRNTLDYIFALEWPLPREGRLNVQAFQRVYSGGHDDLAIQNGAPGASVFVSGKLTGTWEGQLLWMQYFRDGGGMIRPRLNWHPTTSLSVGFGLDVFTGPSDGYFGRYNNRDRMYTEARYTF
jgi:hypothetical protein